MPVIPALATKGSPLQRRRDLLKIKMRAILASNTPVDALKISCGPNNLVHRRSR